MMILDFLVTKIYSMVCWCDSKNDEKKEEFSDGGAEQRLKK